MLPAGVHQTDLASEPTRAVLIVDDSVVARTVIARAVAATPGFMVAGLVADVTAALSFLREARADVILLDIEMPGIDGLTALPDLIAASRGAKVLVVSSIARDGAAATVQALALGAADTLQKPDIGSFGRRFAASLSDKLRRLADEEGGPATDLRTAPAAGHDPYDIVAIGASTGGIHALSLLMREIPASCTVPFIVTQHLPASFMPYFAAQLAVLGGRPCDVASDRLRIVPGRMMVAPGDGHLRVVRLADGSTAVRLSRDRAASGCMPSADPMLASIAEVYGSRSLAVVLSGMGRDGALGAAQLIEAGGTVVVQDQASSVVWGMPGAIARAGGAHAILPPDEIGKLIARRRRPA